MISLTDRASVRAAARDPTLDPAVRAVLRLRYEQLGGPGAHFHVAGPDDSPVDAEKAVGWPLALEGEAQWEWLAHHPGRVCEAAFVLSDDGHAQVLLARDDAPVGRRLRELEGQPAD